MGAQNAGVEFCPLAGLGWPVDAHDAGRCIEEAEVHPQNAAAREGRVDKLGWIAEVQAGPEDDGHALARTGPGHVEDLHAGPDGAPPCRDPKKIGRVRGQVRLRDDRAMRRLLPQPAKDRWELRSGEALRVDGDQTEGRGGWSRVHGRPPAVGRRRREPDARGHGLRLRLRGRLGCCGSGRVGVHAGGRVRSPRPVGGSMVLVAIHH